MPQAFTRRANTQTIDATHVNELQAGLESLLGGTDFQMLAAGPAGTGIVSGCGLTLGTGLGIIVASGTIRVQTVTSASGGLTVTATNHATLPRWGLITSNGTPLMTMGTAVASPSLPAIPTGHVVLGAVYVPAALTAFAASNLYDDKRVYVPGAVGTSASSSSSSLEKALGGGNEVFNSTVTLASSTLVVPVLVGELWRFRFNLLVSTPSTGGVKVQLNAPTNSWIRATAIGKGASDTAILSQRLDVGTLSNAFCTVAGEGWIQIEGSIAEQTVAGDVVLNFAAGVATQNVSILRRSSLSAAKQV